MQTAPTHRPLLLGWRHLRAPERLLLAGGQGISLCFPWCFPPPSAEAACRCSMDAGQPAPALHGSNPAHSAALATSSQCMPTQALVSAQGKKSPPAGKATPAGKTTSPTGRTYRSWPPAGAKKAPPAKKPSPPARKLATPPAKKSG